MKLYIGIDLGTSSVKIMLVDGEGQIRNTPYFILIRAGASRTPMIGGVQFARRCPSCFSVLTDKRWRGSALRDRCTDSLCLTKMIT